MAKAPKTNYMKQCDHFISDIKENHSAEYALMPFNGAFSIIHKRAFNVSSLAIDNILFGDCIFRGRGTAAFQHVTPGTVWPLFPTRPTITSSGDVSETTQGEPFMDRAIVLAGGEHLDGPSKWFQMSVSDNDLAALSDYVRSKERSNLVRGNPYGAAEVLNFTACNEEHVRFIFEEYFGFVAEDERPDYLLYFFGDPTTMLAYATMVFNETMTHATARRGRNDTNQSTNDKVYVHPITFCAPVDNKRLNLSEDPEHMCYFRPVVHASNEVMLYQECKLLNSDVQDPVIMEYNDVHGRLFSQDVDNYTIITKDTFMASQVASVVLSTFAAPVPMRLEYPSAESALNNRLNFIRTAMIRQQKFRNDIMNKDAIAAGSVGRAIMNTISPSVIRTYRGDGDHGNIMNQHGSSGYASPWLPTHRSAALYTAHRAKAYRRENDPDVDAETLETLEMAAVLASSVMYLAVIVDLNNVYNSELFVDRLSMIADAGETSQKSADDYRAHEIKMGGCELGKEMDSAVEVILAHFHYDIARFKRYFLQYSWYFLGGVDGIKLDVDRLPLKEGVWDCTACGGLPFYDTRSSATPKHCFCYMLLRVLAKLTHMKVNDAPSARKVADMFMSELYKNPYSREMTSMKMLLCCRVVESKSRYGSFGSLKLIHANKADGFKLRQKRDGAVTKVNSLITCGPSTLSGNTSGIVPPTGEIRKTVAESSDQKADDSYKEAIELASIVRRILAKCPIILSADQSKIVDDEGSTTLQYLNEVCKRPTIDESGQSPIRPGQVRFDCKAAVKKQITNDPYIKERITIEPLLKKDAPFQIISTDRIGSSGVDASGWGDVLNIGAVGTGGAGIFAWEPPVKKRKLSNNESFAERVRRFICAVAHAHVSSENGQKMDRTFSRDAISPQYASLLAEWQEADIATQKRYARHFFRVFKAVMLRPSWETAPWGGAIGRALEDYLETTASAVRNIHSAVAEELNMTPEELDQSALRDIVHYNNLAGELFSWIDPSSGDAQVSARCERHAHFMLVRHMWDVRAMNNMPETNEIHPLQIEKYTSGASAENGPHSVRISTTLPLYTPKVVEGGANDLPCISLNPSPAAAIDVMCTNDLPIQMKIGVGLTGFETEYGQKNDTGGSSGTDNVTSNNQADYGTVPAGVPMDNGGLFRPFPLLANNGTLVTHRCRVRSANDLATDLRQNSLKMHRLGLSDSVDLTCTEDGVRWVMDYLEDRRDINNQHCLPWVISNMMLDMNAICGVLNGVYYLLMDILSKYLAQDVMSTLIERKNGLANFWITKELLYCHLSALFTRRPELLGTMNVICTCAELYGAKQHNDDPIFDREYERDTGTVKVMIAGSLRLFVGRIGGNKAVRNQLERQTPLLAIRTTYADELIDKNKMARVTTYAAEDTAHASQIITAATVVSYPSRDGAKRFTRIRGGATFNRRTVASGICKVGIKTDLREVTLIKKPLVHFPNALHKRSVDREEVLSNCTLDTVLYLTYQKNGITLTKLAKHFLGTLATRINVKADGWLDADAFSQKQLLTVLLQERFASDSDASKQLFEEEMLPKLYSVMCGGNDDSKLCGTIPLLDSFMDDADGDYDEDDEPDEL